MKLKTWIRLVLVLSLAGCSNDDQPQDSNPIVEKGSFVAVGEDLDQVFQYNYNAVSETGVTFDLTQELGVGVDFLTLQQAGDVLSFYTFSEGRFSLSTKNIQSAQIRNYPDFYTNTVGRSITWGVNKDSKAFFGYLGPVGSRNLGILELDLENSTEKETTLDFNVNDVFAPLLYENILYISYVDGLGNYKLTTYDTGTGASNTIDFQDTPISLLISDMGDLVIFKGQPQTELEKYDAKTLIFLERISFNTSFGFLPGPLEDTFLAGDKVFFNLAYPQPSRFVSTPSSYDLISQEITSADLFTIVNEVEEDIGQSVQITTQVYDVSEQVFLLGYGTFDDAVVGGVFQISLEGELLDNISLPFFPSYFVRD